jgi:translation initiation factor 2 subunit 3
MDNINQELQPLITISTFGRVSNGKSSLIKALTGISPMKFSKELKRNMTLKIGFNNIKIYKCETCPSPNCYQINTKKCNICDKLNVLALHASLIDNPGHSDLMETALSGVSSIDFCLLLLSSDSDEDKETNEHYKAIKILGLEDSTIALQNKLDLITKEKALDNYNKIKKIYKPKYILPTCVQFGLGLNYLVQFLVESIPDPINQKLYDKINSPLKASIIRSFDANKPGTEISKMSGSIVGAIIKTNYIKIGDKIKIIPGIIVSNGNNYPLEAYVTSLETGNTPLEIAYPGGLIGIGLSIDPTLGKEDRLVGNYIVSMNDTENKIFKKCTIKFTKYDDKFQINKKEICTIMLSSIKRIAKINWIDNDKNEINVTSNIAMAGELNDSIIIIKSNHIELYGNIIEIE